MNKYLLVSLLLVPALVWATQSAPNPADYTTTVHVQSSRMSWYGCRTQVQHLTVSIDGKKYELEGPGAIAVLRVGDYKAKVAKEEAKRVYEYFRTYEFLFADGTTRKYDVVGEGE